MCITFALILGFSTPVSADPQGTLYFKGNQTSNYYSIELTNGLVSGVTNLGNPSVNGYAGLAPYGDEPYMFFGSTSDNNSYFRSLSIETGVVTPFPFTGSQTTGLAFDPETETLYTGYDNRIRAYVGSSYTEIPLPPLYAPKIGNRYVYCIVY